MRDITVLLTGCGAPGAPSIIACLRKNGERKIRIVGVDMNAEANGRRLVDKFFQVPPAASDEFIDRIIDICKSEKVDVLIPLVTRELLAFAKNRENLKNAGINVGVNDESTLLIINNKANLLQKMKKIGMDTPLFYVANSVTEVEEAIYKLGYPYKPVCVKGAHGNGSRSVRIIDKKKSSFDLLFNEKPSSLYISKDELLRALSEKASIPQMVVMEYLPGEEYGVDALCENGEVIYIAGRYNYSVNSSIPQGCIIENRKEPIEIARTIIKKLKISGNINFDFIYNSKGEAMLIEINPRLSATIASYVPAGINFPYLGIKLLLHEDISNQEIVEGIKMQRRYTEVFFDVAGNEILW